MRTATILLLFAGTALAGGESFPSGPPVGEKLGDFKAKAFSGPDAGKEFKLLDRTKGGPSLVVFVRNTKITRPAFQFLRPVDEFVSQKDKLAAHVVWVTEDTEATEQWLKAAE